MYKSLLLAALVAVGFAAAQTEIVLNNSRRTCDANNVCCDQFGGCTPLSAEEVALGQQGPLQLLADGRGIQLVGNNDGGENNQNNGGENNQNNGGENNQNNGGENNQNNGGENNEGPQNNAGQSFNFNGQRVTCDENNVCCDGQGGCIPLSEEEVQLGINSPGGIQLLADGAGIQPAGTPFAEETGNNNGGENNQNNGGENNQNNGGENNEGPQNNAGQSFNFNGQRVTCDENNVCCDGQGGCIPLSEEEVQLGINNPNGIRLLADGRGIQPA